MVETLEEAPIELYLKYSYLPLEQQARILLAISGMYRDLLALDKFGSPTEKLLIHARRGEYYAFRDNLVAPPLCISEAHTGESIKLKFDPDRRVFPRIVSAEEDINVYVPAWTASALVAGTILIGGLQGYSMYLGVLKTHYEVQKLQHEVEQLKRDSVGENKSPDLNSIYKNYNEFHHEIYQPNIEIAAINGVSIKGESQNFGGSAPNSPTASA